MTFSIEALLMVGALFLCIGGLIGAIISRTILPPTNQKDLEEQLQQLRADSEQYQKDVAKHFSETSKLVSELTRSYKDVHVHLAKGASLLTSSDISKKIIAAADPISDGESNETYDDVTLEPPRDWAPKTPGQKGLLSDDFGIHDDKDEPQETTDSDKYRN